MRLIALGLIYELVDSADVNCRGRRHTVLIEALKG